MFPKKMCDKVRFCIKNILVIGNSIAVFSCFMQMVIPVILHVAGILGKLISTPFLRSAHDTPQKCARQCLSYSNVKCLAFNYDYGTAGTCELLEEIQAQHVEIHQVN